MLVLLTIAAKIPALVEFLLWYVDILLYLNLVVYFFLCWNNALKVVLCPLAHEHADELQLDKDLKFLKYKPVSEHRFKRKGKAQGAFTYQSEVEHSCSTVYESILFMCVFLICSFICLMECSLQLSSFFFNVKILFCHLSSVVDCKNCFIYVQLI